MFFVTAQRVGTAWKDWSRTLTQMTRVKVGWQLSFHCLLVIHMNHSTGLDCSTAVKECMGLWASRSKFSLPNCFLPGRIYTQEYMSTALPSNMLETSGTDKWQLCFPRSAYKAKALSAHKGFFSVSPKCQVSWFHLAGYQWEVECLALADGWIGLSLEA